MHGSVSCEPIVLSEGQIAVQASCDIGQPIRLAYRLLAGDAAGVPRELLGDALLPDLSRYLMAGTMYAVNLFLARVARIRVIAVS